MKRSLLYIIRADNMKVCQQATRKMSAYFFFQNWGKKCFNVILMSTKLKYTEKIVTLYNLKAVQNSQYYSV